MKKEKRSIFKGIGGRVLLIFISTIVIAVAALAFLAIRQSSGALQHEAFNMLEAVRDLKKEQIDDLFSSVEKDITVLADSEDVKLMLDKFIKYHHEMELTAESDYDMSSSKPGVTEPYDDIYAEANGILSKYPKIYGYYDLFLICAPHGHVMYSWAKEKDLGTNLGVGQYKDSNLAKLWKEARSSSKPVIVDMAPYAPSNGDPAMFIGMPVKEKGKVIGVLAVRISLDAIDKIMQSREGMGVTGSTYLVGTDTDGTTSLRSDRVLKKTKALKKKSSPAINKCLEQGTTGLEIQTGSTGAKEYVTYTPVEIPNGPRWGLFSTIAIKEVQAPVTTLMLFILVSALIVIILAAIVALLFSRSLTTPIGLLTDGSVLLATGDIELKGVDDKKMAALVKRKDELGDIGKAFKSLVEYMREKAGAAENIADGNLDVEVNVSSDDDRLGNAFKSMVLSLNEVFGKIKMSVEQLKGGAVQVSQASQSLSQGATEQASSVEEIASSLTEINSQSRQNAGNADEASKLSKESVGKASDGNSEIEILSQAMQEIAASSEETKKVVKVIDDIAFQINLLALNANVEAARAGKYGKGFAVVADEVRNLAVRSAEASKESAAMVEESIKSIERGAQSTEKSAKSLGEIVEGITKVSTVLDEIALASKEQAEGVEQVNEGIEQINQVTQSTTASSEETAAAAEELSSQADELNALLSRFQLKENLAGNSVENIPGIPEEYLQRLVEQELNKRKSLGSVSSAAGSKTASKAAPKDVIKLDDDDFGEF